MKAEAKGIDVSYHQGNIDWSKVKKDGIDFAIIRSSYGLSSVDKKFVENIEGAAAQGIAIGVYHFMYAKTDAEAKKNAENCAKVIEKYRHKIALKVWADWEYDSDIKAKRTLTKAERTRFIRIFLETMSAKGYEVGVYMNPDYIKKCEDLSEFPLWLAKYSTSKGSYNPYMWQHSSSGRVKGISGDVDMDIYYGKEVKTESANPYPEPTVTLKRGARGDSVKWLQFELNRLIGARLTLDGSFGIATETSVRDYQKTHKDIYGKPLEVDGKVGKLTRGSIINGGLK